MKHKRVDEFEVFDNFFLSKPWKRQIIPTFKIIYPKIWKVTSKLIILGVKKWPRKVSNFFENCSYIDCLQQYFRWIVYVEFSRCWTILANLSLKSLKIHNIIKNILKFWKMTLQVDSFRGWKSDQLSKSFNFFEDRSYINVICTSKTYINFKFWCSWQFLQI